MTESNETSNSSEGITVELGPVGSAWMKSLREANRRIEELENSAELVKWREVRDLSDERLRALLGDATTALVGGKAVLTYRKHKARRLFKPDWFREAHPEIDLDEFYDTGKCPRPLKLIEQERRRDA